MGKKLPRPHLLAIISGEIILVLAAMVVFQLGMRDGLIAGAVAAWLALEAFVDRRRERTSGREMHKDHEQTTPWT